MEKIKSHPRISYNFVSAYTWILDDNIKFCQDMGLSNVVVSHAKLGTPVDAGISKFKDSNLQCVSIAGGIDPLLRSPEETLTMLTPLIDTAARLNAPSCYCLTGPTPTQTSTDSAFDRLIDIIGPTNDYAAGKGVRFGFEHNSLATRSSGFINSLTDAVDLSRATGTGICVELQNCWFERHLPRLFTENVERFLVVQFNDFVVGENLLYNRAVPGDGDIPLEWLIKSLLDAGYSGFFDFEVLGPRIEKEGYASATRRGVEWLSERLDVWGV